MKTFGDHRKELDEQKHLENLAQKFLIEGGFARIWQHLQDRNVGTMTAFRSRYTLAENRSRNLRLQTDIRNAGYGLYKANGHYIEGYGTAESREVNEEVFFIVGELGDDSGRLKGYLKQWGHKYNQDSILYKGFDSLDAVLIGTQSQDEDGQAVEFPGLGNEVSVGTWHPNKIGQFYTRMKGRTFVFESIKAEQSVMSAWAQYIMERGQARHSFLWTLLAGCVGVFFILQGWVWYKLGK